MELIAQRIEGGFRFRVADRPDLSPATWPTVELTTPTGKAADITALVDLIARELATVHPDNSLTAFDVDLAQYSSHDVESLGLPTVAHLSLSIRTQGLITAPGFELTYSLSDHQGRIWMGISRDGMILRRGSRSFALLDPLFSILSKLDQFSELPPEHQSRFTHWAEINQLLPEDVTLDGQLKSLKISSSDCITLDVGAGCTIDPIPLATREDDAESAPEPVVPEFFLSRFKTQFGKFQKAHRTYALGEGHYLMFPERVRKALNTVRDYQQRPETERRAFVANPQKFLDPGFSVQSGEDPPNEIFVESESFLSARIKELGQWSPKLGAFVMSSGIDWLPSEEIEIIFSVGEEVYKASLDDIASLEERIHLAEQRGETTIEIGENTVPITEELKAEATRLANRAKGLTDDAEGTRRAAVHVPVLFDNIEVLEFEAPGQVERGGEFRLPANLRTTSLYPHQLSGIEWLVDHWRMGSPGALLADDMGLGKTLQTLAFLAWIQEIKTASGESRKPHLIVAPTGLLKNWMDEVGAHMHSAGLGDLVEVFGQGTTAIKNLSPVERKRKFLQADWVLTTYETLRDQILWFIDVPWSVVTFDEAQKIKNPAARVTEMSKSLQSEFTLMLTGTPVENSLADLWCIMDGAHPGLLGAQKDFVRQYVRCEDQIEAAKGLKVLLQEKDPPTPMLRRMKEDHLDGLPSKDIRVRERVMSDRQATAYDEAVLIARGAGSRNSILEAIQKLKSTSLIGMPVMEEGLDEAAIDSSARLIETLDILDHIQEKREKVLIFLESLDLQKRLVPFLQRRYSLPEPPMRISGEINGMLRKSYVDRFQSIPDGQFAVMILSPKAGGVGLTLTAANHVIHLSRWWNPAVEDQCTDRVYRIGQDRPVTVWYPIATHPRFGEKSFDWNLHRLLEKKRVLSRSALIGNVDASDLEGLLTDSVSVH